ncbi:MAG: hypothetical protein COA96_09395 [SAR86 cluster bacterium]|uniref:Lysylphosphatidylglycerol synthetase family protein n=1 Tax=SAR86 cluster bacterium TaxID=2030880 RepID=A0A2A5AYX6_9GAMM|nr:MAG: hypothetical protein COA96_09395 [SAR86 cluster bacterium]
MSDSNSTPRKSDYLRPVIAGVLLISLCLAFLFLLNTYSTLNVSFLLNNSFLVPAILLQVLASLLFIFAWKALLSSQAKTHFSFAQCTAHIGITLLGKYLPGKIWGLLGRTYLLNIKGLTKSEAASLLLADQFITFLTGIAIGVVALAAFFSVEIAIFLAAATVVTIAIVGYYYASIMSYLLSYLGTWLKKISKSFELHDVNIKRHSFYLSASLYLLHWLCTATVVILLFHPLLSDNLWLNSTLIMAAIPLAMLSGFLALWAPGGIGVREAVIVAVLMLSLPLELSMTIAVTYRIICILIDLSLGAYTLIYYSITEPDILKSKQ